MTTDEILEMAKQCGDMTIDNRRRIDFCFDNHGIEKLARLVEARTREECAELCENTAAGRDAEDCAAAIRGSNPALREALGEKK